MQNLVPGDIHGCYLELQALLEKEGSSARDFIIAEGLEPLTVEGREQPDKVYLLKGLK